MKDNMIQYAFIRMSSEPSYPLLEDDNTEVRRQLPEFFNKEFNETTMLKDQYGNPLKYVLFVDNDNAENNRYIKLTK